MKAKDKYVLPFLTVFQGSENLLFIFCSRGCIKRRNIGGTVKYNTDKLMQGFNFIGLGKGYNSDYHNASTGSHFLKCGIAISGRKLFLNLTLLFTGVIIFFTSHFATLCLFLFHTYLWFPATWNRRCFWLYVFVVFDKYKYLTKKYQWTAVPFEDK